jgi:hypothetical protein
MKNILLALLFFCASNTFSLAQCFMMPFVQGRTLTYDMTNAQGKPTGSVTYYFKEVNTSSAPNTALVVVENIDTKGKVVSTNEVTYKCDGNAFSIDMHATINPSSMNAYKDMSVTGEASYLDFPNNMSEGTALQDALLFLRVYDKSNNEFATITSKIFNRKTLTAEAVQTASGNYNCIKISANGYFMIKTLGLGIPIETSTIEWWSNGIGLVKSETYNKSNKLVSTMVLRSAK